MALYLSYEAEMRLEMVQNIIDLHARSDSGGRCVRCGELEPCTARGIAHATFDSYGVLPRRTPGVTRQFFR